MFQHRPGTTTYVYSTNATNQVRHNQAGLAPHNQIISHAQSGTTQPSPQSDPSSAAHLLIQQLLGLLPLAAPVHRKHGVAGGRSTVGVLDQLNTLSAT